MVQQKRLMCWWKRAGQVTESSYRRNALSTQALCQGSLADSPASLIRMIPAMLGGFQLWNPVPLLEPSRQSAMGVAIHGFNLCSVCVPCVGVCLPLLPESAFPQGLGHDSAPASSFCLSLSTHERSLFGFLALKSMTF